MEHGLLEVGQELLLDDKQRLLKAGTPGVEQGVIDDFLPMGPHRVNLLKAAVTAAMPAAMMTSTGSFT